MPIIGVVENMAGFVCPKCSHESVIFPPTTGGAQKMCEEMGVRLLGSLPLDPHMMQCCDTGVHTKLNWCAVIQVYTLN